MRVHPLKKIPPTIEIASHKFGTPFRLPDNETIFYLIDPYVHMQTLLSGKCYFIDLENGDLSSCSEDTLVIPVYGFFKEMTKEDFERETKQHIEE